MRRGGEEGWWGGGSQQRFELRNNASTYCITIHYDALQARENLHVQKSGIDYSALIRFSAFPN